jgi:transglutaminase-like putative cysteine protease
MKHAQEPTEATLDTRSFGQLCLTVAAVVALHAPHLPWWLSALLLPLLAARWWQRRTHPGRVPAWLKLPLLLVLALAITLYYGSLFGRAPGAALAVGLLVLKTLESERARDARVGVGFACFTLMTALLFGQGMVATAAVVLGLLPALATLRALEPAQPPSPGPLRELLQGLALLGVAVPLALLAFVFVPRLSTPLWGAPGAHEERTGLSDRMTPAGFTRLLTDDNPAMRVSFDGPPPPPELRYFRAYVMGFYDGSSWHYHDVAGQHPATIEVARSVDYRISLEPSHQRVLPMLDVPLRPPPGAHMRRDHVVMADKPVNDPLSYRASSAIGYHLEPQLGARHQRWLQLPDGFNPRTLALGQGWRRQYGDDDAAIVQAALSLFHDGGFRYTLAPAPLGRNAMDDFLFDTREGFCEHYSSAFTVLMRAAGIPARVVTGYQGGYWSDAGHYLLVRNSDAHAWSEVWLARRGWVRVDPTAAVRPQRVELGAAAAAGDQLPWSQTGWLQSLRNHWDIVNHWWNQGVVGFDALRQRGLLTPFGIRQADAGTLGLLLAISCVLCGALGVAWALRRRAQVDPARAALRELERRLARCGVARRQGEGPRHYLTRAARTLPAHRQELKLLMDCYLELRYAHAEPPPESLRHFRRQMRNFHPSRVVK